MKKLSLFLLMLFAAVSVAQARTIYEWKDAQGVMHFTDNPDSIPPKYEKRVREREMNMRPAPTTVSPGGGASSGAATGGAVSGTTAAPSAPAPLPQLYGEHTQQWWRDQFASVRGQLEAVQTGLGAKKARLEELHRQRIIFQRSRDRVSAAELQAEIDRDASRVRELESALATLTTEAARAGVPAEWR